MTFYLSELKPIPKKFFKSIMPVGRPKHFAGKHDGWSACGVNMVPLSQKTNEVDCLRCRKTEAYKIGYMAKNSGKKE